MLMLQTWLKQLEKELELEIPFIANDKGEYTLSLGEALTIYMTDIPQGFRLHSVVTPLPKNRKEDFLSFALQGNLFGQGTHGAVLGIDTDGNMLTLSHELDYNPGYKEFRDTLEDFINTADFWRNEATKY